MQKHVYNMQCFKISEPLAQSPPSYLYHAHKASQTAETSSERVWFSCANTSLNALQISGKEEKQGCCETNKLQFRSIRGGWGKVCAHSTGAKPGKRTWHKAGTVTSLTEGGSWPLACPAGSRCWAEAAANITGQHWRATHASPVPCSAWLIRHQGFLKGRYKKEEQEERKDCIYQHLTCTSRDSSTTSLRGAGQGIALSIGLRTALERPLRTAKPDPRGWPV